jgi:predicted nucleic acid-binding protein
MLRHFRSTTVSWPGLIDFTSDDAIAYAGVRAKLERAGTPIGPLDTLIAAQALSAS